MRRDANELLDQLAELIAAKIQEKQNHNGVCHSQRLKSIEDAAEDIGRTKPGMDHLIASGKIRTVRADRRVMIDVQDLDRWIEENKT
jgi:hypothetical protein